MAMAKPNFSLDLELDLESAGDNSGCGKETVSVEPPAKQARFANNSLDVAKLIGDRVPTATKRTTNQWLKMFSAYCEEAKMSVDLQHLKILRRKSPKLSLCVM